MDDKFKREILDLFKKHGVIKIKAHFSGGGDDGQVHDVEIDGIADAEKVIVDLNGYPKVADAFSNLLPTMSLKKIAKELVEYLAENVPFDWVNDDGGSGDIIVIPGEDSIRVEGYENFTASRALHYEVSPGRNWELTYEGPIQAD
ncbi:DUF6878 family protein [Pseudolabrys sp.]|uniref:DUF6878 family protein n=1 Tax=Pseudolabrys sp. TaxID=1960880 RepID=UPI003D12F8D5